MSAGSHKFTVRRIAALSLVSLWLAGCSNTSNPPAPVSSVDGGASTNTNSGMLITPPPKMGSTSTVQQTPQIQPVQRPTTQSTQIQPVAEQPVQMENGRIVSLSPIAEDAAPSPLLDRLAALPFNPQRIRRPAVRRGYLTAGSASVFRSATRGAA